jgi:acyl-CoA synthetase (NDP forming)
METTHKAAAGHDLTRLFNPRAVAIVGASSSGVGGQTFRAMTKNGFAGNIYPVNPRYEKIEDVTCYPSITAIPKPCDLAVVVVSSNRVLNVIDECGIAGVSFVVILSGGFREIGESGAALEHEILASARRAGIRIIGPNCLGLMNVATRMYAGFGTAFQNPTLRGGPLALVSQSGGVGFGIIANAAAALGMGFDYIVSTGNEADISALDFLEFFLEQEGVEAVATYLEGIQDGRRLLAVGERALELGKPILVWKVGNSGSGRRAAVSHTANLTSGPELYQAVFRQGGFIEVRETSELLDAARAFLSRRVARGRNVAVITSSGGTGVLLADRCEERGLLLPQLSDATVEQLREFAPEYASLSNPVDVTAQLGHDPVSVNRILSVLLKDPDVDQVIFRRASTVGSIGSEWAKNLVPVVAESDKPVLISMRSEGSLETVEILDRHRIPWFETTAGTVFAAKALYDLHVRRERFAARVRRTYARREVEWPRTSGGLGEHRSKELLATYGIPVVREILIPLEDTAKIENPAVSFPLAVKIESRDIPHKTEAGAVRLNIANDTQLQEAVQGVVAAARRYAPKAKIEGVLLQEMARGTEIMLGVVNDAYFGPVVALGLGGIFAETLRDVTHRCAPIDVPTAHVMIDELRASAVLKGARGLPPADIDALAETISCLSFLAVDHADRIQEIDINPLFVRVRGQGVVAADALIVLKT